LGAVKQEHVEGESETDKPRLASGRPVSWQPLVEPLTNREMDVLELLAARYRNKEIAEKLFVSSETVKGHLRNVYQKLDARNRREAVVRAEDLGIIKHR
jgi:ATP/maltotriose-dependent transcriptional regulator MalT